MSSSLVRSTPAATRQQLDELDALLQRMLDLPVRPGDEPPAPTPEAPPAEPGPRAYPPSYMVVETNTPALTDPPLRPAGESASDDGPLALEEPVPGGRHDLVADQPDEAPREGAGEEWVPFRSSWQPSAQTWGPLARTWEQALGRGEADAPPAPAPFPAFPDAPPAGPVVLTRAATEEAQAPRPAAPPAPAPPAAPSGPLVWFNAAFDVPLLLLGPVGRWLRGPAGRNTLGVVGIASLLGAAALVAAEGMGWTW